MPSTAPLITQSMHDLSDDLRLVEHAAIMSVVRTSTGRTNEILDFQMLVNRNLPMLNTMLAQSRPDLARGGARFVSLKEDRAWGANTAAALTLALLLTVHQPVSLPPSKSAGVPAWYAQNREPIDALLTAVSTVTPPLLTASQQIPLSTSQQQTVQDTLDQGMQAAQQVTATPMPGGPGPSPIVAMVDTTPPEVAGTPTNLNLTNRELLALEVNTDFAEGPYGGSRVIAAQRGSSVPWLALGAGAGVLGGLMWWWTKRRRRA